MRVDVYFSLCMVFSHNLVEKNNNLATCTVPCLFFLKSFNLHFDIRMVLLGMLGIRGKEVCKFRYSFKSNFL